MLKEIFEQPAVMHDVMRGRVRLEEGRVCLGGIEDYLDRLKQAKRIVICACGTSWHAGLIGEYLIEEFARIPVEVDYASEFRYRNPIVGVDDVVIVISQSGETADTLAALRTAKEKGALVMGICNVVGSTIARETLCGMYTHAGPEVGVASTKAFTAQVIMLYMLALALSKGRTISHDEIALNLKELSNIPEKASRILDLDSQIKDIAERFKDAKNFLYLGRGYNFPVALEGALKLKEISYIHAEGYPAAEMKHGPIALIDEDMPVIFIATRDSTYAKILSNIEEVRSRKGRVIAIASEGDQGGQPSCRTCYLYSTGFRADHASSDRNSPAASCLSYCHTSGAAMLTVQEILQNRLQWNNAVRGCHFHYMVKPGKKLQLSRFSCFYPEYSGELLCAIACSLKRLSIVILPP